MKHSAFALLSFICLAVPAYAAGPEQTAFDNLKKLAGEWEGTGGGAKVKVNYQVTGAGSALVETQFPGTGHEMVTVYHMDGQKLMLTHYCAAHNQPTMQFIPGKDASTLRFAFVSGSNMKPTDMHMHGVAMKLVSKDHLLSDWQAYSGGKPGMLVKFDLHRSTVATK